jgi:hypothetical protein
MHGAGVLIIRRSWVRASRRGLRDARVFGSVARGEAVETSPERARSGGSGGNRGCGLARRAGSRYIDAAAAALWSSGYLVSDEDAAQLSPLGDKHINIPASG